MRSRETLRPALPATHRGFGQRAANVRALLMSLSAGALVKFLFRQKLSYILVCFYLFLEYVRPQSVYPALYILPWSQLAILLALACYLLEGGKIRFDLLTRLVLVYTAVIGASTVMAYQPSVALAGYESWISWVLVFLIIANIVNTEQRFLVFMFMFLVWNMKMAQHGVRSWASIGFHFRTWGATGGPGWFENSGEFGIEMDVFMPLAICFLVALRRQLAVWKVVALAAFPAAAVLSMVASSSRGALIGGAAAAVWLFAGSKYRVRAALSVSTLATLAYVLMPAEQLKRFQAAGTDNTSALRLTYWAHGLEMIRDHPLLGIGYNNWLSYYHANIDPRGQVSHNIFIQCGSELGIAGLTVLLAIIVSSFVVNRRTRAIAAQLPDGAFLENMARGLDAALIGFLVSGSFVTVLYYPYLWVNLAMTAALYNAARARIPTPARHVRASQSVIRRAAFVDPQIRGVWVNAEIRDA